MHVCHKFKHEHIMVNATAHEIPGRYNVRFFSFSAGKYKLDLIACRSKGVV